MINSLGTGGAERVFSKIANFTYNNGIPFQVLTIINNVDYPIDKNIRSSSLSYGKKISLALLPVYFIKFVFFLSKHKFTLIQSHLFWSNYFNIIASFFFKHDAQVVHCVSFLSKFTSFHTYFPHYVLCRFLLKKASLNIFKSKEMQKEYVELFDLDIEKTTVIYNPVNVESSVVVPRKIRDFNQINIVVIGRFHKTKRHSDLIEIAKGCKGFNFHCVGNGDLLTDFKRLVSFNGLDKQFVFHGWLDDPREVIKFADIYLSCSESEGFPNALIEAMSFGLPCIHSDCKTGPREIFGEKIDSDNSFFEMQYGILFPVGDCSKAIKALNYIANNSVFYNSLSKRARERALDLAKLSTLENYINILK